MYPPGYSPATSVILLISNSKSINMKKIIFLSVVVTGFLFSSCSDNKAGMSDRAKKNLESMHGVSKAIETGDMSKLGDYLAEDVIDHAAEGGPAKGFEKVKAELTKYSQYAENMKSEVIKELADDEYVMCWMKFTGTMKMDQMGMKKGDTYNTTALEVSRFNADGKAVEHWTFVDPAEMMKMMGGAPPVQPAVTEPSKDSTGK